MAIDYGTKRVGLAVTDPLRIISSPLTTIDEPQSLRFLQAYFEKEAVDTIVVGYPLTLRMKPTDATESVIKFVEKLKAAFPDKLVETVNEQFTSKMARKIQVQGGIKKKKRRIKGNLDKISASIILQHYMDKRA